MPSKLLLAHDSFVRMVKALLDRRKEGAGGAPGAAGERGASLAAPEKPVTETDVDPLDAYFDRLDAAFASYGATAANRLPDALHDAAVPVATAPDARARTGGFAGWEPDASVDSASRRQPSFANALVAMFAPEGDGGAQAPSIPEELIDEIARRVVAKLGDESMRRLVIETAERVVRDEIERIKQASRSGSTHATG